MIEFYEDKSKKPESSLVGSEEIMLGMTAMYEEMLKKDAENKLALAEIFELATEDITG